MGFAEWMRIIDTVGGLAQMTGRLRPRAAPDSSLGPPAEGIPGGLETRLAGVVVAALREAFDRDKVRMDLERAQIDSERRRIEEALYAELRRQAAERALWQLRLIGIMAITGWMLSAALAVWLPGMRDTLPRSLLGAGWLLAFGALGCAFAGSREIFASTADGSSSAALASETGAAKAAPWVLLVALGAIAASLLAGL